MLLCGCFQATNKFYLDSDIATDVRLEGHFEAEPKTAGIFHSSTFDIQSGTNKHYVATFREQARWIKLDVVLFKNGTNVFLDISHLADNGIHDEAAGGPTPLQMLHVATKDKTHSVIRLHFLEDAIEFNYAFGNPVTLAIRKESGLKSKNDGGQMLLTDSTENLRKFIAKVGSDDSIFMMKARFVRRSSK